jgi:uncharacterized protein (TIGR03435 family)
VRTFTGIALATLCFGQSASRTFEVASIKPREGPYGRIAISTAGQRLTAEAMTVRGLIMYAYDVKNRQVAASPALTAVGDTPYDIVAKAEGDEPATKAQFRAMLQSLLADRFQLRLHREMRETPVYALTVGKGGPKFHESPPDASELSNISVKGRNYMVTAPLATVDRLIDILTNFGMERPLVDRTGLTGTYSINLTYTPETHANRAEPDPGDISIFTAVQEQLGLRLVPQTAPVEFLVIDHVEKPASN